MATIVDNNSGTVVNVVDSANPSPPSSPVSKMQEDAFRSAEQAARQTLIRRIAAGGTLVALLALMLHKAPNYSDVFLYHPTSMLVACLGVMPEMISLAMKAKRSLKVNERNEGVQSHVLAAFACKLIALVGYLAIWKSKVSRGKSHYSTWHGKVGLISGLLLLFQVLLGCLQFFSLPLSAQTRGKVRNLHRMLSTLSGVAMGAAFALGFTSNYSKIILADMDVVRYICGASSAAAILWALFRE